MWNLSDLYRSFFHQSEINSIKRLKFIYKMVYWKRYYYFKETIK